MVYYQVSLYRYPLTYLLPHSPESMQRPAPHLRVEAPAHSSRPQLAPGSVLLQQPQEWQREEWAHDMDPMRTHMLLKVTKYERTAAAAAAAGDGSVAPAASGSADDLTVTTSAMVLGAHDSVHTLLSAAQTLLAPHAAGGSASVSSSGSGSGDSVALLAGPKRSVVSLAHPLELVRTLLGMTPLSARERSSKGMSVVQPERIIADLFRAGHAALAVSLAPGFTALSTGEIITTPSGASAAAAAAGATGGVSVPTPMLLPLNGGRPVRRAQPSFFEVNRIMMASVVLGMGIFVGMIVVNTLDNFMNLKARKRAGQASVDAGSGTTFMDNLAKSVDSVKAAITPSAPANPVKVRVTGGGGGASKQDAKPEAKPAEELDLDSDASDYEQLQARRKELIREQLRQRELAAKERRS